MKPKLYYGFILFDPIAPNEPYSWFCFNSIKRDQTLSSMLQRGFKLIKRLDIEYYDEN